METTIVLLVSRPDYLRRVLTAIELVECDIHSTNILCIVDGPDELFVRVRNLVADLKFKNRLTVKTQQREAPPRLDITQRRQRIANAHNQARSLIAHDHGYILSIEDDTIIPPLALKRLHQVAITNRAFGFAEGVELGRWGVPYVGAWKADDIYDLKELKSVEYKERDGGVDKIDAGGLYCALIRADLYKQHEFTSANGLGPDVNFGLELRQLGFDNFIHWAIHCKHVTTDKKQEIDIIPSDIAKVVTITRVNDVKWRTSY